MYRLKDFFVWVFGMDAAGIPSDEILCYETEIESSFNVNKMQDSLMAYTYTLVEHGSLTMMCNGRQLTLEPGDLYIYSPGFQVSIMSGSDDYRALCLLADEELALGMPTIRDIIRSAFLPVAEWGSPVIRIPEDYRQRLSGRMREVIEYLSLNHRFRAEALRTLFTLFMLDVTDIQERAVNSHKYSVRTTELIIEFMRLLPHHFIEHHDIAFYASEMCITPTHLSRVVRQITGRTVLDYINQMLLMEATWLLQTSDLPLATIAERLHFADQSSFSKFFTRMKGVNPKQFRVMK